MIITTSKEKEQKKLKAIQKYSNKSYCKIVSLDS
jgi:hypothetical protein